MALNSTSDQAEKLVRERVPNLAKVAGELLSVPATSTDAERSFSKLTNIQTHQRQQVSFETLKMSSFFVFNNSETNI
jgi:hypothetical protein